MKTYPLLCAVLAVAGLPACGIEVSRALPEETVQGNALLAGTPQTVSFSSVQSPTDTSVAGHLSLDSVVLSVTATAEPAGDMDCFDFVQSVSVYVEGVGEGSVLPRIEVAHADAPGCVRSMYLQPVGSVNLQPYVREGFRVVTEAAGAVPPDDVSLRGTVYLRLGL